MSKFRFNSAALAISIALSIVAYAGLVRLWHASGTPVQGDQIVQTILLYSIAFVAYLGVIVWMERYRSLPLTWLWAAAICFRLIMLFVPPILSGDVYRYLWDGHVASQGVSPYLYAINAPELDYLDIPLRSLTNHAWMASPYLPAAQFLFWLLALVFPLQPFFFQVGMMGIDLAIGFLLIKLLDQATLPRHRVFVYLWNPLVIIEVTGNAHMDVWMVLLALAAVYLTLTKPSVYAGTLAPVFLALATLTKPIPLLLLPILFWHWNWRQRSLFGAVTLGLLIPFALQAGWGIAGNLDGTGLFGALRIYLDQWNFNSGLFHWIERWLGAPGYGRLLPLAKNTALFVIGLILLVTWLKARRQKSGRDALRLLALPLMAYLLLTPTVHPWYSLIVLAFLPLLSPSSDESHIRWLSLAPWLYLSWALILSYLTYLDPLNPAEREWVRQVEWLPTLLLLTVYPAWKSLRPILLSS